MHVAGGLWPALHSAPLDYTTTSYHYDHTSRSFTGDTDHNLWLFGSFPTTLPNDLDNDHNTISSLLDPSFRRTPDISQGFWNLTGTSSMARRRQKTSDKQTHVCLLYRRILNTYVIGLMCLLGIFGNLVSIMVLQKDKNNKVAIFLLQSLAAADVILLTLSFFILSVYHGFVVDNSFWNTKRLLPYVIAHFNPLGMMSQSMVVWCTVLLAINRYIAICKPFAAKKWLTMYWARIQVATVFLLSILLNLPRHFLYDLPKKQYFDHVTNKTVYYRHLMWTNLGNNWHFRMFYLHIFYNAVVLVLPLVLLVCFNIPIIRSLQRSKRLMQQNSLVYSGRRENNITMIMIIIILQLVVCHLPDKITAIYKDIFSNRISGCPHPLYFLMTITNVFVLINSSTDFIVYYLFRKRFRYYLKSKICCAKGVYYGNSRASQTEVDLDVENASLHRMHSNSTQPRMSRRST